MWAKCNSSHLMRCCQMKKKGRNFEKLQRLNELTKCSENRRLTWNPFGEFDDTLDGRCDVRGQRGPGGYSSQLIGVDGDGLSFLLHRFTRL